MGPGTNRRDGEAPKKNEKETLGRREDELKEEFKELDEFFRKVQEAYYRSPERRAQIKAALKKAFGSVYERLEPLIDAKFEAKCEEYLAEEERAPVSNRGR